MSIRYLFSSLPTLEWKAKPDISFKNLRKHFELNLSESDWKKAAVLMLWVDLNNAISQPDEESFDKRGVYSKSSLLAKIANKEALPDYFYDFYEEYQTDEERKAHLTKLLSTYYSREIENHSGFVKEFLEFEHAWRVVMTAFRAKRLGKDIAHELQFEDPNDPNVAMMLAQSGSSSHFVFPYEFREFEGFLASAGADPRKQYMMIARYRFDHYCEIIQNAPFTLQSVLAYMLCLWILEEYFSLDEEKGKQELEEIVEKKHES